MADETVKCGDSRKDCENEAVGGKKQMKRTVVRIRYEARCYGDSLFECATRPDERTDY